LFYQKGVVNKQTVFGARNFSDAANNNVSERYLSASFLINLGGIGLPDVRPTSAHDPGAFFGDNARGDVPNSPFNIRPLLPSGPVIVHTLA
jgi:hypothetical protein